MDQTTSCVVVQTYTGRKRLLICPVLWKWTWLCVLDIYWILLALNSFTFDSCSLLNWLISSLKVFSVSRAVRSHHKHMTCYDFIEHNETVDRLICTLPTVYIYTYTIYVFLNKSYQWRHEEGHLECVDTTKSNEVTQKCLNKAIKLFL